MTRQIVIPELEAAPNIRYTRWSQEDKKIVATYYGRKDTQYLANYLGKSINALQGKTNVMGITCTSTDEEREELIRKIEAGEI